MIDYNKYMPANAVSVITKRATLKDTSLKTKKKLSKENKKFLKNIGLLK